MTSEQANNISIKQYLSGLNIRPVKEKTYYGMFFSPLRTETTPSFKVDYRQNLWYDFGSGEGGTMIDLVMKIHRCSFSEAMRKLESSAIPLQPFSFHGKEPSENPIRVQKVLPLTNPALIGYLTKRNINIAIAKQHCSEVYYSTNGKPYFAIGFQNNNGGYELRNEYFKGSISPKDITTIQNGNDTVMLFEGFMDYLSYLSLKNHPNPMVDTVVLNSVANLKKAIPFLELHRTIHTFLDNDESGKKASEEIRRLLPGNELVDQSVFYKNHKDLNDFLRAKNAVKHSTEKPKFKMKR